MSQSRANFWKSAASHGLIVGLVIIFIAVITWLGKLEEARIMWWVNTLATVGIIYYVMKLWRDNHHDGIISYGQALGYGVAVMFLASVIYGFYNVIYLNYLDPEAVERSLDLVEQSYYEMGFSEERIETLMEGAGLLHTPFMQAFSAILALTFRGFVVSLITALFIKREGDPYQTAMKDVD